MPDYFVTSFCNFPHRLRDGKPVEHECYVLRPRSLQLEREEKFDQIEKMHDGVVMRRGVKRKAAL
jgi:hypothetical protein